ncbi:MAG: glycosyltransferase family 4 protein [Opitutaceae bacterium]
MIETPHAFFHLDAPAASETPPAGRIILRGWFVAKSSSQFVDLRARVGQRVFPGIYGLPRPDLAEFFKAREPRLLAAFEQPVVLASGANAVVFEACTLAGEWLAVHTLELTAGPATSSPAPPPQHAPLRAVEFARALHLLLRRAAGEQQPDWSTLATEIAAALPHPATARFAHAPFHGHFDEPAALARGAYGRVNLIGWLFHEADPVRRVFATFDLQTVQELKPAGDYAGVPDRFPQFANAANCRWKGFVDCPAQLPQPRTLRLYAELTDGSWHLCNVQHSLLWDVETEKRGYPRFSSTAFLAATWGLHRALRRRGTPTERLRALLPELRPVWHAFRTLAPRRGPSMGGLSGESCSTDPAKAEPRRLLLVTHNLNLEGAPLFLAEFAAHCRRVGRAEITLVSGSEGPLRRRYEQLGASVKIVDLAPLARSASPAAQRNALRHLVREVDFAACDLVVANTLTSYWAIHAARAAHRPSLFYIHESTTPAAFFHSRSPAAVPGIEQAFSVATRVSFLTAATRRYYTAFSDGANYRITPGWIDLRSLDAVRTARPRSELRRRLGIAEHERLVINVGTVCDRKGQILFARAVDLLCRRHPAAANVRFLMVGGRDTDYDRDLLAQLATLNRPNLAVVPESEDAATFYGAADVFVCSSFEESFPRVILEAMAFSLPIVSSAVHGVPEIVRHDEEALLVTPGDTCALADALEQILAQPAWAAQLGQRARRRLEQTFTTERVQPLHYALACETAAAQI